MALRPRILLVHVLSALAMLALAAGCGSTSHSTGPPATGATATGFTQGVITRFGTIHLGRGANEKVFHTEGAALTLFDDGVTRQGGNDAQLFRVGMKVNIYCDKDDSTHASKVMFMDDLEGPITAKPSAHGGATFDVLTVPVIVDANTHLGDSFEDAGLTIDSLKVGNVVQLSGQFDASDVLHATFIQFKSDSAAAGRTFEIKGPVMGLGGSPPTQTFTVHSLSITTDMNTRLDNLESGLADSAFVQVKTKSTSAPFLATHVKGFSEDFDDDSGGSDDDHGGHHEGHGEGHHAEQASVEGFVTGLSGSSPNFSFMLAGRHVVTSSTTKGLSHVAPNAKIEAEGPVDSAGDIMARKIDNDD